MIPLSVLDQSPIRAGTDAATAIEETRDLARLADQLGYERYWLAEHHNTSAFAGPVPEILIGQLASDTVGIRVGSGGVMMMHYAPLKIAETFRMLETLHPGRIDLGLGRAAGTDGRTAAALRAGPQGYDVAVYPQLLDILLRFLHDANGTEAVGEGFPEGHPFQGIHANPSGPGFPEVWLLGSGIDSALIAADYGQAFAHAYFINPDGGEDIAAAYRKRFKPSANCPRPRVAVAVSALAAETEEEAHKYALARNIWALRLLTGRPGAFPSLEEAQAVELSESDKQILAAIEDRSATGTPAQVRTRLLQLVDRFEADELVILTITHDHAARRRSYELLADAFRLRPRA